MKQNIQFIDIEIDKLTRSIENRTTGDNFQTEILLLDNNDSKSITKGNGWLFNWKVEFRMPFACKLAFHRGFEGYLSFTSKSTLIGHYEKTLGAQHIGGQIMVINTISALKLIDKYFKE